MRARHTFLSEHSLHSVLSAIEIYNKPDFKDREQIFSILIVTAWEALLKAKILKENKNKLTALYVKEGHRYKRNRSGVYLTIGIDEALSQCRLARHLRRPIARLGAKRGSVDRPCLTSILCPASKAGRMAFRRQFHRVESLVPTRPPDPEGSSG